MNSIEISIASGVLGNLYLVGSGFSSSLTLPIFRSVNDRFHVFKVDLLSFSRLLNLVSSVLLIQVSLLSFFVNFLLDDFPLSFHGVYGILRQVFGVIRSSFLLLGLLLFSHDLSFSVFFGLVLGVVVGGHFTIRVLAERVIFLLSLLYLDLNQITELLVIENGLSRLSTAFKEVLDELTLNLSLIFSDLLLLFTKSLLKLSDFSGHFSFTSLLAVSNRSLHNSVDHHVVALEFKRLMVGRFHTLLSHVLGGQAMEVLADLLHVLTRLSNSFSFHSRV